MKLTLNFEAFRKKAQEVKSKLDSAIKEDKFINDVGNLIVNDIKRNARSGYTIEKDGSTKRMEDLSDYSIKQRKALREAGNSKSVPYSDSLSNLSMSGQLIDSIGFIKNGSIIEIDSYGNRYPYKNKNGDIIIEKGEDNIKTNKELLRKHQYGDQSKNLPARPIVGIRTQIYRRIDSMFIELVRRKLKVDK